MGVFDRFKKGLSRTREKVTTGFRSVLRIGQRIDQDTISRLEDANYDGHSLSMLHRVAAALNQELAVVMTPRKPPQARIRSG